MMPRTFLDAAADAALEAHLARKFAEEAEREDGGEADLATTLWNVSRFARVRSLRHDAEALALVRDHEWDERADKGQR